MLFESIFTTLPMFVCLFGTILLLTDNKKQLPKRYLAFFLLLSSANYFTHAAYFNHQYKLFAFLDNLWIFTSLAAYPLFYYYIRLLTKDEHIYPKWLSILLPAFLLSIFSFALYFMMPSNEMDSYIQAVLYHKSDYHSISTSFINLQQIKYNLFKAIYIVQVPGYLYFGYRRISRFDKEMKNYYSNMSNKNMCSVMLVFFAFVFASVISIVSSTVGKDYFIDKPYLLIIPSLSHSLFLIAIIYGGKNQNFTIADYNNELALVPQILQNKDIEIDKDDSENNHNISSESRLKYLLETKKIFIDSELRITDVARMMGTNRTYISRIINADFNTNFNDIINKYRVEYAKEIMKDEKYNNLTLSDIANNAGFSSISTFYRVFNKIERMSPGRYRENVANN